MKPKESTFKYIQDTVWAKLAPSKIHKGGIGVIAIRNIPIHTQILQGANDSYYQRYTLTNKQAVKLNKEILGIILDRTIMCGTEYIKEITFKHPNADQSLQSFMNHSTEPNYQRGYTIKEIKKGEEITENYKDLNWSNATMNPLQKKHLSFIK